MLNLNRDCIYLILNEIKVRTFYMFTCKYMKSFVEQNHKKPNFREIYDTFHRSHNLIEYIFSIFERYPHRFDHIIVYCRSNRIRHRYWLSTRPPKYENWYLPGFGIIQLKA